MEIVMGIIKAVNDPSKRGMMRFVIPELSGPKAWTDWVPVLYPAGMKFSPKLGQMMLIAIRRVCGVTRLYGLGHVFAAPGGVSQAPLSALFGPTEYSKTMAIEVDPANQEKLVIQIKGQQTKIEVDTVRNLIEINPGPNDAIITPGGSRLAVEGDPVEVMTSDGPARGRILQGSVPMTARKIT